MNVIPFHQPYISRRLVCIKIELIHTDISIITLDKEHAMKNAGIFIFNDIELMDFAGPFEVFSVANELEKYTLCNTFTFAEEIDSVTSVNGLKVIPDYSFENCPDIDILIIPGGIGTVKLLDNSTVLDFILSAQRKSEITFSVCSGARILAKLGLLDGLSYTTHHEVFDDIISLAPHAIPVRGTRFVDNGKIMTSAGISAGIDLSLHVIGKLFGQSCEEKTRAYMEYGE